VAQQRIGRYEVLSEVAKGGQATVYRARDTMLGRVVALKVLHPHLAGDPQFRERFLREARMAASLTHPNVVTIFDVGEDGGQLYMAMEYLPSSLHDMVKERGALGVEEALGITRQITRALQAKSKKKDLRRSQSLGSSIGLCNLIYRAAFINAKTMILQKLPRGQGSSLERLPHYALPSFTTQGAIIRQSMSR